MGTNPSQAGFDQRWDLTVDFGGLIRISISDLTALFAGSSGYPPMNGGNKVFNTGFQCTAHPVYGD
jgi:hypothetical protein